MLRGMARPLSIEKAGAGITSYSEGGGNTQLRRHGDECKTLRTTVAKPATEQKQISEMLNCKM
jgi:hypothetical protein